MMKNLLISILLLGLSLCNNVYAIDIQQIQKILAGDTNENDWFGFSVSISGDYAIVGAAWADNELGSKVGAAYIFNKNTGGQDNWGEVKKLTASDAKADAWFGFRVSISGDYVIVGAAYADNEFGTDAGAAYIFNRNTGGQDNWGEVKKLTASDAKAGDSFGSNVSIEGDYVIVGAAHADNEFGTDAGTVYIFNKDQGGVDNWGELKKLTASDAKAGDYFGYSVSISGDYVIVGANKKDAGDTSDAGAAYIFNKDAGGAGNWGEVKKMTASDAQAGDNFGIGVSISGDYTIVGAIYDDNDSGSDAGAAYIYNKNAGGQDNWGEVKKLTASDAQAGDNFGWKLSILGDYAIVGATLEDNEFGTDAGAAYIFNKDTGGQDNWGEVKKLTASDAKAGDSFGYSIAISGDNFIIGAAKEDMGGSEAGAAYMFKISNPNSVNEERTNPNIFVFPNPTSNILNLNFDNISNINLSNIKIYSMYGNEIALPLPKINGNLLQFDITSLYQGEYYISIFNGNKVERASFVKVE